MIRRKERCHWLLGCSFLLLGVGVSCSESNDSEATIPPRQGAEQTPSGGGKVSEDEACESLREAEETKRVELQCNDLERPECPYYVRPAGTGCWEYSENSVNGCLEAIAEYTSCSDFDLEPCVLSATRTDADCPMLGGEGGAPSSNPTGSGGNAGQTNGAAGAPGGAGGSP